MNSVKHCLRDRGRLLRHLVNASMGLPLVIKVRSGPLTKKHSATHGSYADHTPIEDRAKIGKYTTDQVNE